MSTIQVTPEGAKDLRTLLNTGKLYKPMPNEVIERLHAEGMNDAEIAREIGRTTAAVWAYRKSRGLKANAKRGYNIPSGVLQ